VGEGVRLRVFTVGNVGACLFVLSVEVNYK